MKCPICNMVLIENKYICHYQNACEHQEFDSEIQNNICNWDCSENCKYCVKKS